MARIIGFAGGAFVNVNQAAEPPLVPQFDGPNILDFTVPEDIAISDRDYSGLFSAVLPLTFSSVGTALPTGLSLSAAGVLSGTPTTVGATAGIQIRASDGTDVADSNLFTINVVAVSGGGARSGMVVRSPVRAVCRPPVRRPLS